MKHPEAAPVAAPHPIEQLGRWRHGGPLAEPCPRHVHTAKVLSVLEEAGWRERARHAVRSHLPAKRPFARHLVMLEHPELSQVPGLSEAQRAHIRLLLQNSHDGSASFSLRWGVYRFACDNGLVYGHDAMRVSLRHERGVAAAAREGTERMVEMLPGMLVRIAALVSSKVGASERAAYIRSCYDMRMAYKSPVKLTDVRVDYKLPILREEDEGKSAWLMLNRVQEKVVGGGIRYRGMGRPRSPKEGDKPVVREGVSRPVREIKALVDINQKLWRMAEELVEA